MASDNAAPHISIASASFGSWRLTLGRKPLTQGQLTQRYAGRAKRWSRTVRRLGFRQAYTALIDAGLPLGGTLPPHRTLTVLDAGVGTGDMSLALHRAHPAIEVTAIDLSSDMLATAERRFSKRGISVRTTCANVTDLPFANGTFDCVLAAHIVEHLGTPEDALNELFRVLRPGGILIACVTRNSVPGAAIQWAWRTHRPDPRMVVTWMQAVGFDGIQTVDLPNGTMARWLSQGYVARKPQCPELAATP